MDTKLKKDLFDQFIEGLIMFFIVMVVLFIADDELWFKTRDNVLGGMAILQLVVTYVLLRVRKVENEKILTIIYSGIVSFILYVVGSSGYRPYRIKFECIPLIWFLMEIGWFLVRYLNCQYISYKDNRDKNVKENNVNE